jgi:NHL repeat
VVSVYRLVLLSAFGAACLLAAETPPTSYTIQTVAGSDDSGDGGTALSIAFIQPEGIAADSAGDVYVADAADHRVRKIAPDGSIRTIAGTGIAGFAGDGGPANAAQLDQP